MVKSASGSSPAPQPRRSTKGAITRQRIIDTFVEMLEECPIWEIKVSSITQRIGISSQLLYAHFKSIEDILLAQSEIVLSENPDLSTLIDGDWEGKAGLARAELIVANMLAFWDRHRTIMRVIESLGNVGNPKFAHFRAARGRATVAAFQRIVERQIAAGRLSRDLDPALTAWNIVSRIQIFGGQYPEMIAAGHDRRAAIRTVALMTQMSLGYGGKA